MIEIPLNTSYVLAVGPFVDPVSAIAVSTASIADSQAAVLIKHASSIEANIKSFTFSHSSLASGMGFLHLRASILNVVGKVDIVIEYPAQHLPFRQTVNVISSGYYNWKYGGTSPASLASGIRSAIATEVWNTATRILTASTNFTIPTASAVASQVWSYPTAGTNAASNIATQVWQTVGSTTAHQTIVSGVWNHGTRVLTASTNFTIPTAAAIASAVWTFAASGAAFSTVASHAWAYPTRILTASTNFTIPTASATATEVWQTATRVLTASTNFTIPTAAAVASAVWTFAASGVAFSTIASHVWAQKESVTIATGGFPVGGYAAGAVTAAAIAADAITSSELASTAAEKIADAILNRDLAGGASGDTRNVRNAFRMLRNRVDASTGTVYAENDSTAAWSFAVSTAAGNPIVAIDPD